MALQSYYEPFFSFSDVNRLFDEALTAFEPRGTRETAVEQSRAFRPKLDVHEDPEKNIVTATFELPGLKKEDISIDLQRNRLVVTGETKFEQDSEENGWVVKERRRGKFSRTLPVPADTKPEQISASMAEGVLTVTFPKAAIPEQVTKRITIS